MLRARLLKRLSNENVDDLIETTRATLGRLIGHALGELPHLITDQVAFSEPALEIARLISEMLDDAAPDGKHTRSAVERNLILVPIGWDALAEEVAADWLTDIRVDSAADYTIYSKAHDVQCHAEDLYRPYVLRRLRKDLDRAVTQQAVSVTRLAQRLGVLFHQPVDGGLRGGQDHGRIDRARLAQIVANPLNPHVHALPAKRRRTDAAVTFLIDTTGSMKVQRYEAVAVLCDTFVRSLETIGVQTEVLGFSTASWAGGASAAKWQAAGSPQDPGRLADTMHIVYKSFDRTWRQSRAGIAAMLRLDHYREGVDGEAIEWAAQRLLDCCADRRYLVLISDGQPMEATTAAHNRESLLLDHLRSVVDRVEQTTDIRLGAVSVDQSMEALVANSTAEDLSGTLTLSTYDVLHHLFATKGTGTGVAAELASHPPFMVRTCHAKHERAEPEPFTT
ncbi:MAG: hypothetical protein HKN03_13190 [Acidimicrobiales bacterium]|nr:hypothetical protein [Acidimicrobiales bacterium]